MSESVNQGTVQASSGQVPVTPVGFGYYPREGSRVISLQYNWASQTSYNEDLQPLQGFGVETTVQSAYVDNSDNPFPVTIVMAGSQHSVTVPGKSSGTVPIYAQGFAGYTIFTVTTFGAVTRVFLSNIPVSLDLNDASSVGDTPIMLGVAFNVVSGGTGTFWTPPAGVRGVLTGFQYVADIQGTISAAGDVVVEMTDGSNVLYHWAQTLASGASGSLTFATPYPLRYTHPLPALGSGFTQGAFRLHLVSVPTGMTGLNGYANYQGSLT